MEPNETFQYTYSARQQDEIRKIRDKYIPRKESKMEQLRRLDESSTRKGTIVSIGVGTLSLLVFGTGLCCTLIGDPVLFVPGILIGIAGMIGIGIAYPLYQRITRDQRKKLAPEILRLTEELMEK